MNFAHENLREDVRNEIENALRKAARYGFDVKVGDKVISRRALLDGLIVIELTD